MLAVKDWLPSVLGELPSVLDELPSVLDEPPALSRGVVGVGRLDELPPVAPTSVVSTLVAPEPGPDDPEFEPVAVAKVLAPVIEVLALDPVAVKLSALEAPEVDPVVLDPSVVDPLESFVWMLVAVAVGVSEVAVVSPVAAAEVLIVVL